MSCTCRSLARLADEAWLPVELDAAAAGNADCNGTEPLGAVPLAEDRMSVEVSIAIK